MSNEQRIAVFCCENSAYKAVETVTDPDILASIDVVRLPCSGKIEAGLVLKTLERSFGGVIVLGCPEENCKYISGNKRAGRRIASVKSLLTGAGLDPHHVRIDYVSSVDTHKVVMIIKEMQERVRQTVA